MKKRLLALLAIFYCVGSSTLAHAAVPPDLGFGQRRLETLQNIAAKYQSKSSYSNCVELGFSTLELAAKIKLDAMGKPNGISAADAASDIATLADEAYRFTGTSSSPCTWENRGWPGAMLSALGLGYILHEWKGDLPQSTRDKIVHALGGHWMTNIPDYLSNLNINLVAGLLLGGEAIGKNSAIWQRGKQALDAIYARTILQGGIEMNAPLYSTYHYAGLMTMLALNDDAERQKARILLDYELIVQAHLYLPGGGLGAPQARDRHYGGALDGTPTGMHRVIGYLTGDTPYDPHETTPHLIGAVTGYQIPAVLRSIFLDKGDGYDFWAYTDGPAGRQRFTDNYDFGTGFDRIAPWQAVVLPGGQAMMGVNYGFRNQAIHVSMGIYAHAPDGSFPILYQYQPYIDGDTRDDASGGLPSGSGDTQPNDFVRELYDYQRMVYGRTMISIWDPTLQNKQAGVVRQEQNTRVHFPDYAAYGGQVRVDDASGWLVGKVGDAYIAYHPLGSVGVGPQHRDRLPEAGSFDTYQDSSFYFYRLDGRSGGIYEMATTDQFATIADYLADLKTRHLSFSKTDPMTASFDALDPETGQKVRIKLVYHDSPDERRFVDGQELTPEQALDHGFLNSPFVSVDPQTKVMRLQRGCYDRMVYDLKNATVSTEAPDYPDCMGLSRVGPIFSPIDYYGDRRNFQMRTDSKWSVINSGGDKRLFLEPEDLVEDGDRLGEWAVVKGRTFGDFTLSVDAKSFEDLSRNALADYAVIFGWQDPDNYYYMLANAHADESQLFVVQDGQHYQIGQSSKVLIPDTKWHHMQVARRGTTITVTFDGQQVLELDNPAFGEGSVGVGSYNDSALFDNFDVRAPDSGGDANQASDAGGADGGGLDAGVADASAPDASTSDAGWRDADAPASLGRDVQADGTCGCNLAGGRRVPALLLVVAAFGLLIPMRRIG